MEAVEEPCMEKEDICDQWPRCGCGHGCARKGFEADVSWGDDPVRLLHGAADILDERGKDRDVEQERSMSKCVAAFNVLTGHDLSTTEGWKFMIMLKLTRSMHNKHNRDDYLDGAAYFALANESHAGESDDY